MYKFKFKKFFSRSRQYSPLPDEVLMEILSRLPADCVAQCRRVCRRWQALLSSRDFVDLHLTKAEAAAADDPTILILACSLPESVYRSCQGVSSLMPSDLEGVIKGEFLEDVHDFYGNIIGSCNGLLAFRQFDGNRAQIVNPITREKRYIMSPKICELGGYICAFFFDRFEDDYKLLHVFHPRVGLNVYHLFSLSQSAWTRISSIPPTFTFSSSTSTSTSNCPPPKFTPPAIVGDALHWVVRHDGHPDYAILVFNIKTQTIHSLPQLDCVKPIIGQQFGTRDFMHMTEKSGKLCLGHTNTTSKTMNVWLLEDYENWGSWVIMSKIDLSWIRKIYPMVNPKNYFGNIKVAFMKGDEALLNVDNDMVYHYDLGTHEKWQMLPKLENGNNNKGMLSNPDKKKAIVERYHSVAFTYSLVSPNNVYSYYWVSRLF